MGRKLKTPLGLKKLLVGLLADMAGVLAFLVLAEVLVRVFTGTTLGDGGRPMLIVLVLGTTTTMYLVQAERRKKSR